MTTINPHQNGIPIDPDRMLSGKDLMDEAMTMPKEEFSLSNGVSVVRRGIMFQFAGKGFENMSPGAMTAALQASKMGGDAGRAMFDAYRRANPEEFDGSRTFATILAGANKPPKAAPEAPEAGVNVNPYKEKPKTEGTSRDDFLEALDHARMWAFGGDDVMKVRDNSELHGGDGNDTISARNYSTLYGDKGDDDISAGHSSELFGGSGNDKLFATTDSVLYGEEGDDTLSSYDRNTLYGGDGRDDLSAYNSSTLLGGAGNDRLQAYENGYFDGGQGGDYISGYNDATIVDLDGNNYVDVYRRADVTTGDGNDWISAYGNAQINAGDGNNMVTTYDDSTVYTGNDADLIQVGRDSTVSSGGGDDKIIASYDSVIVGGTGNDRIQIKGASTIHFAPGDGHDIVSGGRWGHAYRQTDNLAHSVLAFGEGITADSLNFQKNGNDLIVSINDGADSVTLRDYQRHGIPSMSFTDGTTVSSADIMEKLGPGEEYKPESQVLQNWHDANAAYQKSQTLGKSE